MNNYGNLIFGWKDGERSLKFLENENGSHYMIPLDNGGVVYATRWRLLEEYNNKSNYMEAIKKFTGTVLFKGFKVVFIIVAVVVFLALVGTWLYCYRTDDYTLFSLYWRDFKESWGIILSIYIAVSLGFSMLINFDN